MEGFLTKPAHLPQLREALQRYGSGATVFAAAAVVVEAAVGTPEGTSTLLDMPTIRDVSQALTPRKYAELLQRFLDGRGVVVAELRQAIAIGAHAELRSAAHSLKGAAASLGLSAVSALAQRLQTCTPQTSSQDLLQTLDELEASFEQSVAECVRSGLIDADVTPPAARAPA